MNLFIEVNQYIKQDTTTKLINGITKGPLLPMEIQKKRIGVM